MKLLIHLVSDKRVIELSFSNSVKPETEVARIIAAQGFMHVGPAFTESGAKANQQSWVPYHAIRLITIERES